MEIWDALTDILLLLLGALVFGTLLERLRQSAVVGFILAGTLLGPYGLDLVSSREGVRELAELGVSLLLFSIGLEFSRPRFRELRATGRLGVIQVVATSLAGAAVARALGLEWRSAIGIGAIVSLSSTACVLRVLSDRELLDSGPGRGALGILLIQDVAVIPLAFLMDFLALEGGERTTEGPFALILSALLFGGALWAVLRWIAPWLLGSRILSANRELSLLVAVVAGLGAAGGAHSIGVSPALGAFIAGIVLAGSPFAVQVRSDIASLRTVLLTLFFGSVGMLADPRWILDHFGEVLALLAALVAGKSAIVAVIVRLVTGRSRDAISTGLFVAQIGEFSFLLATLGGGRVIPETVSPYLISATLLSLLITPYLIALGPRLERALQRGIESSEERPSGAEPAVLIIGFGPSGQRAAEELERLGRRLRIVDLNSASVNHARELGHEAFVGDAGHAEVLAHAGLERAELLLVTVPDPGAVERVLENATRLCHGLPIAVRARYHRVRPRFEAVPGVWIIDEEEEVGRRLGAVAAALLRNRDAATRGEEPRQVQDLTGETVAEGGPRLAERTGEDRGESVTQAARRAGVRTLREHR